ncbi:MAG: dihydroorotate dehydrogenase electron transfer subunit [Christensenellaceae bacterium]|nr:dihydroorotate dehydrogenase electron transfer subunit [Christensenellaceae bacterium]MEA5067214.1 dihydroorotate dehydrogenase electron transfer subunit [Eubacteriales bacterium]MEA5068391.1 dihydroorotate dehydrogenase electron transfer subunit [Christensenellaceae bacterium]
MIYRIARNDEVARAVYRLELDGDTSALTAPGQFVNIKVPGCYLRRPISVCDWSDGTMTLIYKVLGEGTKGLAQMEAGASLDLLTGLGNGFSAVPEGVKRPLLVGGGLGVAPLYRLMKALPGARAALGFASAADVFLRDAFEALGEVHIITIDGSAGAKGLVTDLMAALDYDYVFACGPEPMMRAVHALCPRGQFSFEGRMACGFGACMGCSRETNFGSKRVCVDGPVFAGEEIAW